MYTDSHKVDENRTNLLSTNDDGLDCQISIDGLPGIRNDCSDTKTF